MMVRGYRPAAGGSHAVFVFAMIGKPAGN